MEHEVKKIDHATIFLFFFSFFFLLLLNYYRSTTLHTHTYAYEENTQLFSSLTSEKKATCAVFLKTRISR